AQSAAQSAVESATTQLGSATALLGDATALHNTLESASDAIVAAAEELSASTLSAASTEASAAEAAHRLASTQASATDLAQSAAHSALSSLTEDPTTVQAAESAGEAAVAAAQNYVDAATLAVEAANQSLNLADAAVLAAQEALTTATAANEDTTQASADLAEAHAAQSAAQSAVESATTQLGSATALLGDATALHNTLESASDAIVADTLNLVNNAKALLIEATQATNEAIQIANETTANAEANPTPENLLLAQNAQNAAQEAAMNVTHSLTIVENALTTLNTIVIAAEEVIDTPSLGELITAANETIQSALEISGMNDRVSTISDEDASLNVIAENIPVGSYTGVTLNAIDVDGQNVTYTISEGVPFSINSDGQIVTTDVINFEATPNFTFNVTATSADGTVSTTPITIDIANVNEVISNIKDYDGSSNSVAENSINGTLVGIDAGAIDVDGDSIAYMLVDANGNEVTSGPFGIDATTGVVSVRDGSQLDYENGSTETVTVKAISSDGSSSTQSFTVAITDILENTLVSDVNSGSSNESMALDEALYSIQSGSSDETVEASFDAMENAVENIPVTNTVSVDAAALEQLTPSSGSVTIIGTVTGDVAQVQLTLSDGTHSSTQTASVVEGGFEAEMNVEALDLNALELTTMGLDTSGQALEGTDSQTMNIQSVRGIVLTEKDDVWGDNANTSGNDTVKSLNGNDVINTGEGNDIVRDKGGSDVISTGSGNDTVRMFGNDANIIDSGSGNDTVVTKNGNDQISSGSGNDKINAGGGTNTIDAGSGDDKISSGSGNDTIAAGDGNDYIYTAGGTNTIDAGSGNDTVKGGTGSDTIFGGSGKDNISGNAGNDIIDAGEGNDIVSGGSGADTIHGGSGNDILNAGSDNDTVFGDEGDDILYGSRGNDILSGGSGNDTIDGGADTDSVLFSGNRSDYTITYNASDKTYTIKDNREGSPEGTDSVKNIEKFVFADKTLTQSTLINQAPTLSHDSVTVNEDNTYTMTVNDFGYSDKDGDRLSAVKIDSLPSNGILELNGTAVTVNQEISADQIVSGHLLFIPNANSDADGSFSFKVSDGQSWSASGSTSVIVNAVSDTPVLTMAIGGETAHTVSAVDTAAMQTLGITQGSDGKYYQTTYEETAKLMTTTTIAVGKAQYIRLDDAPDHGKVEIKVDGTWTQAKEGVNYDANSEVRFTPDQNAVNTTKDIKIGTFGDNVGSNKFTAKVNLSDWGTVSGDGKTVTKTDGDLVVKTEVIENGANQKLGVYNKSGSADGAGIGDTDSAGLSSGERLVVSISGQNVNKVTFQLDGLGGLFDNNTKVAITAYDAKGNVIDAQGGYRQSGHFADTYEFTTNVPVARFELTTDKGNGNYVVQNMTLSKTVMDEVKFSAIAADGTEVSQTSNISIQQGMQPTDIHSLLPVSDKPMTKEVQVVDTARMEAKGATLVDGVWVIAHNTEVQPPMTEVIDSYSYNVTLTATLSDTDGSEKLSPVTLNALPSDVVSVSVGGVQYGVKNGSVSIPVVSGVDTTVVMTTHNPLTAAALNTIQASVVSSEINGASTVSTVHYTTPIILDMDGDGVHTGNISGGAHFDIDADGDLDSVGWSDGKDGLLVRDINHDGMINDGSELFGSSTVLHDGTTAHDGYEALRDLDGNQDNVIDSNDAAYSELKLWMDANQDGKVDDGEMMSLKDAGVESMSLKSESSLENDNGNIEGLKSSFTTTEGETHEMADVWLATAQTADDPQTTLSAMSESIRFDGLETMIEEANAQSDNPLSNDIANIPLSSIFTLDQDTSVAIFEEDVTATPASHQTDSKTTDSTAEEEHQELYIDNSDSMMPINIDTPILDG
ncbi:MAG: Ig-like domain-containing protein, partial [Sulfuricurvum sp.]|nr:Ig-like domain-containing protein [Sulfuricurvum sp.]